LGRSIGFCLRAQCPLQTIIEELFLQFSVISVSFKKKRPSFLHYSLSLFLTSHQHETPSKTVHIPNVFSGSAVSRSVLRRATHCMFFKSFALTLRPSATFAVSSLHIRLQTHAQLHTLTNRQRFAICSVLFFSDSILHPHFLPISLTLISFSPFLACSLYTY